MILTYVDNSVTPNATRSLTVPVYAFTDAPQAALYPGAASVVSTGSTATQGPYQIAVDGTGNLYVGNATGKNVVKVPAGAGSSTVVSTGSFTLGSGSGGVNGVAVDGAGDLFIADNGGGQIYEVHFAGTTYQLAINLAGTPTTLSAPTALAVDSGGNLFIADNGNNRILKVAIQDPTLSGTASFNAVVVNTGAHAFSGNTITGLAVDASENLYVTDSNAGTIVKITAAGGASIVAFPSVTLSRPEGVAVDGMGNVYVSDGGTGQIVQLLTSTGTASVIPVQGLTTPTTLSGGTGQHLYGVSVDSSGNIFIADSSNNRIVKVPVAGASLAFPNTASGSTNAAALTAKVTNIGNQSLGFSANPTYTSNFSKNSADTNLCTASTLLLPGTTCDVSAIFTPQTAGSLTANITVTNNTLNTPSSQQLVSVRGTAIVGGDSTSTSVTATPSPNSIGQGATISATVTDSTVSSGVPSGSVTLVDTIGSTTTTLNHGAPVSLSNGTASLPNVLLVGVGTHTITANYAGASGSFLPSSSSPLSLVVNKGTPTVTVASASASADVGKPVTFSITVSSSPSAPATGTVQLLTGSTVLGSSPLDANGKASITTSSLAAGSDTVTAQYSGDANYLTATGSVTQVEAGAGFSVVGPSDVVSESVSAPTPITLTLQPVGGFTGTVTFSCTGLPPEKACSFTPPSVVADGSDAAQTVTLTFTNQSAARSNGTPEPRTPGAASAQLAALVFLPLACAMESNRGRSTRRSFARRKSSGRKWMRSMWLFAGMVFAVGLLSACSSRHVAVAPESYSVNVVATATQTGSGYHGPSVSTTVVTLTFVN